ncbi:MAG: hypothetical protein AVDCRST_MAG36-2435 [uncultured Nocardioidaceae bacterium]|uniref:Uncharacterized protein n=1 Tax=uncultured Nocardioidaceae bacterium TaxID=253824 RepID=A0A6J4MFD0_9ACTN|nr:MAG: hypothetical protein AVDCRST_MAG36-2435 [uncultured Nocardioidaceae bacterium]
MRAPASIPAAVRPARARPSRQDATWRRQLRPAPDDRPSWWRTDAGRALLRLRQATVQARQEPAELHGLVMAQRGEEPLFGVVAGADRLGERGPPA